MLPELLKSANAYRSYFTRFHWQFMTLDPPSPFSIPVVMDVRTERIKGAGIEHLLMQATLQYEAEGMMEDVRTAVGQY